MVDSVQRTACGKSRPCRSAYQCYGNPNSFGGGRQRVEGHKSNLGMAELLASVCRTTGRTHTARKVTYLHVVHCGQS